MRHFPVQLAILTMLTFAAVQARAQYTPPSQAPGQAQPPGAQPSEPPHHDAEPNPEDRALEKTILKDINADPHMAYSRVQIHADDKHIVLNGVVLSNEAKEEAAKIAGEHAGTRKVQNKLKVNPNIHPGPGL